MKTFRSPLFWLLFVLAGLGAALLARTQFARAFPILDQSLTMNRDAATRAAEALARTHGWSPAIERRTATQLWHDADLTTFIELEAGGKENLGQLLREGAIAPYRWQVRLFRAKDAAETLVQFRPDGRLLGFFEKLPESQTAPELSEADARTLAETRAAALGLGPAGYNLVDTKSNRVVSGRLDHAFTYERPESRLGAARDQIVLTVRGDRFCGASPAVKLPEDFFRRYTAMRASNTNLQLAANLSVFLLLGLGGCLGGLIYLARRQAIAWRGAFIAAVVLALGALATALNQLPLAWFGYDTALSPGEFQTRTLVTAVLGCLGMLIFSVVLAAAEGLGRAAFPAHPQLWKALSRRAAGSREVAGGVLAGYVGAALFCGYAVAMARFGVERLGWWMPSSTLINPGLLGTALPWIPPVFVSFLAGLTEECLFRAVPLAGAVLLGRRFGRTVLWVGGALLLQALVFGAAHSNYPTMPGWARLVELFIPSLCFGAVYLRFGLIPGIVAHYVYDIVWMGLPLVADRSPGATPNIVVLAGFALAPLVWALACRLRAGAWHDLPAELRNGGWLRPTKPAALPPAPAPTESAASPASLRWIAIAGALALVVWAVSMSQPVPDMPGLSQRREQAIAQARAALATEGINLGADWEALPVARSDSGDERLFVWQTSGQDAFRELSGKALALPGWRVRFVRSTLQLPDRAEEYRVFLTGAGTVQRYEHVLPEARPGAQLAKAEAQALAERELLRLYQVEAASLALVSANETKQPARSDWRFIWKDPAAGLAQGESRYTLTLAGDTLAGHGRHVFVTEEWTRAKASGDNARSLTTGLLRFVTVLALLAALVVGGLALKRHPFAPRPALLVAAIALALTGLHAFVRYPARAAWLATDESFEIQAIRFAAFTAMGALFSAAFFGALAGLGAGKPAVPERRTRELLAGLGAGFLFVLAERVVPYLTPDWRPWHCGIDGANAGIPYLGSLWIVMRLLSTALVWVRVQAAIADRFRPGFVRSALVAVLGFCFGASDNEGIWLPIILSGVVNAAAFVLLDRLVARTHPSVLVAVVIARCLAKAGNDLFLPGQPAAVGDGLVAVFLILALGGFLYHLLRQPPRTVPAAPPALPPAGIEAATPVAPAR